MLWLGIAGLITALSVTILSSQFGPEGVAVRCDPGSNDRTGHARRSSSARFDRYPVTRRLGGRVRRRGCQLPFSVHRHRLRSFEPLGIDDPPVALFASVGLVLAAGYHPLHVVLRGLIDELLFGQRPDPLVAATSVADRVGDDPLMALRGDPGGVDAPLRQHLDRWRRTRSVRNHSHRDPPTAVAAWR